MESIHRCDDPPHRAEGVLRHLHRYVRLKHVAGGNGRILFVLLLGSTMNYLVNMPKERSSVAPSHHSQVHTGKGGEVNSSSLVDGRTGGEREGAGSVTLVIFMY